MRFVDLGQIEIVPATESRYGMQQVFVDTKKKRLVATDGSCIVVLKAELEPGDTSGFIPTEALSLARRLAKKAGMPNMVSVVLDGTVDVVDQSTNIRTSFPRTYAAQFPEYERVLPHPERPPDCVFDIDLLVKTIKALRSSEHYRRTNVVALWREDDKMLVMTEPNGGIGVVMQLRTTKEWETTLPFGEESKPEPAKAKPPTSDKDSRKKPGKAKVVGIRPTADEKPPEPPPEPPANDQQAA